MPKVLPVLLIALCLLSPVTDALAKGGFSSSGRGFSGGGRAFSSRSYSSPSRSYSYSTPRTTTTTRSTTINRSYGGSGYGGYHYGGGGYYHPMMYPGFGMGYGYSNGLIQGLIIGNLMHPQGTTVYSGGGYSGSALLYPDGRVVDQSGYQVGMYQNGQFNAMQGGMVAQAAPAMPQQMPQPVIVERESHWFGDLVGFIGALLLGVFMLAFIWAIFAVIWGCWHDTETETITETTTTTTEESDDRPIRGELQRQKDGSQFFVIDPTDKSKTWLNDHDDMYEDAAGNIWRLV